MTPQTPAKNPPETMAAKYRCGHTKETDIMAWRRKDPHLARIRRPTDPTPKEQRRFEKLLEKGKYETAKRAAKSMCQDCRDHLALLRKFQKEDEKAYRTRKKARQEKTPSTPQTKSATKTTKQPEEPGQGPSRGF